LAQYSFDYKINEEINELFGLSVAVVGGNLNKLLNDNF